ncbi:MAG TPA: hypothetical protein VGK01_13980, partial [Candidatus Angelobacter sp.]
RVRIKIGNDRQRPVAGGFATLWKNRGTHFMWPGPAGKTCPKSVNCGEILPNSYALEQAGSGGTQVIVLLGVDCGQSSAKHPSNAGPTRTLCIASDIKARFGKQIQRAAEPLSFAKSFF